MLATRFTELVGCERPLQQAGVGAVAGAPPAGGRLRPKRRHRVRGTDPSSEGAP